MYDQGEYARNRKALLAQHPGCAVHGPSCTGTATTVDHVVAVANGGDNSLANLRPACSSCNSHLGGRLGRARQLQAAASGDHGFLGSSAPAPSPASRLISPGIGRNGARFEDLAPLIPEFGTDAPRLVTPTVGDGTLGGQVAAFAAEHSHEPMAWHRLVWDRVLATDRGRLRHRQGLVSTARQNGKSWALEMLAAWWMLDRAKTHGAQNVAWVSHDLRLSEQSFLRLARLLEPYSSYRSNSFGRQRLELDNGSTLAVQSNTVSAGHGNTYGLVVADEVWRLRPEAISLGLGPTQRAVREPLMVLASTAGDEGSVLLRSLRERALTAIEHDTPGPLCFLEWSMAPNADPYDPTLWGQPNPCLGRTLDADTLIAEAQGDRNAFLRGSLNVWTASAAGWLQPGVWDRCLVRKPPPPSGGVVACEVSMSGERFSAVRSFQHNGVSHASVLISTEDESELWDVVAEVYPGLDALAITPTLEVHLPDGLKRKTSTVGLRELARWTPLVRSMINGGQVAHAPSALLDEHVARGVQTKTAGLSTAHSSGEITLARCLVWAVAMASRPSSARRPAIAVART